jgi:hypothetical protein
MAWRRAVLGVLVACGSSTLPPGPPAGDAAVTRADAGGGPGLDCPRTVDAYCASSGCVRLWQDVPRCSAGRDATRVCGAGHAFVVRGVDTTRTDYYDAAGELEAVVLATLVSACVAGPPTFVAPACGELEPVPACPDAPP